MATLSKKNISVFGLIMINVIAIDSLRTLPIGAMYGFSALFFYLIAAIAFFIPSALVSAELATGWPETGGLYIWVREAFGKKMGFLTIWLQWFYNVCWYPTIMSLVAVTLAYCINPALANNKLYMISAIMTLFWGATFVNCLGLQTSSLLSTITAIIGTLIPMLFITVLSIIWMALGKPIHIDFSLKGFFPATTDIHSFVLLTTLLYGLIGMEMSASHANEVKNPQQDYPKALLWSTLIILGTMVSSSLAVAIVVPAEQLNIVSGLLQAFEIFFTAFHMPWFMPILAFLIVCGAVGSASAWMLGPTKGLLIASQDGSLPSFLGKINSKEAPHYILFFQGIVFTLLCLIFLLMPTVSSGFWVLSNITTILSLLVYLAMFSAAVYLRYKHPHVKRSFMIPGGKIGLWITCSLGFITSFVAIIISFLPPRQVPVGNIFTYELIISTGVLFGCLFPFLLMFGLRHARNRRLK